MEGMRTLLRSALGKSLVGLREEDRLAAAWTVVCGRTLSARGTVVGYDHGVVELEVVDGVWLRQMTGMRQQLVRELGEIAKVPVSDIRFMVHGAPTRGEMGKGNRR